MGWLGITRDKDPKEAAYNRGEKSFQDVIENQSDGELLYSIDPREDFNTGSTLIVHPGEVALFEKNGVIQEEFTNGRYVLSTENYPFISRLRNMLSGGVSSFNCRVHWFREGDSKEIKWGTETPIEIEDRIYNQEAKLGIAAVYKIKISNPTLCLKKLLGNNIYFKSEAEMNEYWGGELSSIIREVTYNILRAYPNTMLDAINQTRSISKNIQPEVDESISEYGIQLVKFSIVAINILDDFIERVRANKDITRDATLQGMARDIESQAEAKAKINIAQGDLGVMQTLGENWGKQQTVEILKNISVNPGAGGIASAGAGLGMGLGAGNAFGNMANQIITPQQTNTVTPPPINQNETKYYLYINNMQMGPFDLQIVKQFIQSGQLTPDTLVWKEGLAEWIPAKNTEIQNLFNQGRPTPPPPPVTPNI
ncbi:MAG: SPFH domain-containing protein [Bacteroidales bacterium]|nr:SPFH domain-containing protein [Bacteroidales bacterium]